MRKTSLIGEEGEVSLCGELGMALRSSQWFAECRGQSSEKALCVHKRAGI